MSRERRNICCSKRVSLAYHGAFFEKLKTRISKQGKLGNGIGMDYEPRCLMICCDRRSAVNTMFCNFVQFFLHTFPASYALVPDSHQYVLVCWGLYVFVFYFELIAPPIS